MTIDGTPATYRSRDRDRASADQLPLGLPITGREDEIVAAIRDQGPGAELLGRPEAGKGSETGPNAQGPRQ